MHAVDELEEPTDLAASSTSQAREQIRCLQGKLSMAGEVLIEKGDAVQVVVAAANRRNADLIVIGRSSRDTALGRLRPNAYSIIRNAPSPVVSV